MASNLHVLKTYYSNIMRADFAHIPGAHQSLLASLSAQVDAGTLSLAAAEQSVAKLAIDTTSVASLAYNFFTGGTPYAAGLDYLVSPNGLNPNNLNSAYYQSANIENRYINFAVNLGKLGEGQQKFAADYGALDLTQTLAKAYTEIFGTAPDAAKIDSILNTQVPNGLGGAYARADYFAFYGRDGLNGTGTKAALIGWLMAEAAKVDVGVYAQANDAFLADLGVDGVAKFRGNLLTAYGPSPAAGTTGVTIAFSHDQSVSPTSANSALQSTANNDTITGTTGLDAGQVVNGGGGNDTVSVTGTIYGQIKLGDGDDTVTLGDLGQTVMTIGNPAQFGSVDVGGGSDTVTLTGGMVAGTSLTASGTGNVLHVATRADAANFGTIKGFQTVYIDRPTIAPYVDGAAVIYASAPGTPTSNSFGSQVQGANIDHNQVVVVKDTSFAVGVFNRTLDSSTEIHLDHFNGAPTTGYTTLFGGIDVVDGGYIQVVEQTSSASSLPNTANTVKLHVDSDSTAGLIFGYTQNPNVAARYKGPMPNLIISGQGALTAEIGENFTHVDATQAGDLNLTYRATGRSGVASDFLLGDGTNTLTAVLTSNVVSFVLGKGADTFVLGAKSAYSSFTVTTLSNLSATNGGAANATVNAPPEIVNFTKGVDHIVLDALIHAVTPDVQLAANSGTSLTAALIAVSAQTAVNTAAVFTYGGDTYIYAQDSLAGLNVATGNHPGDGLIKIVGVAGLTVGTGSANVDIHYG